tara:strand:+ start:215 stop:604 length:390 start_codon:yes stop_codon:yes gene_type:complete
MPQKFLVEIISPEKTVLKSEASEVIIPSFEGEIGILKDHINLITFLRPGLIKIVNGEEKIFFVENGTVEFSNNNLLILTSTTILLSEINKNFLEKLISESEEKLNENNSTDKEKYLLTHKIQTLKNISL